jgi:hypothetical protein
VPVLWVPSAKREWLWERQELEPVRLLLRNQTETRWPRKAHCNHEVRSGENQEDEPFQPENRCSDEQRK